MWLLKNSEGKLLYIKPNKIINIGRKQGELILENDESVSRKHASIIVQRNEDAKIGEPITICVVKDVASKYGSTIQRGNVSIKVTREGCILNPSDKIKFGLQHYEFFVDYVPFITATSNLEDSDKLNLRNIMDTLGGHIGLDCINAWTHLTVTAVIFTEKIGYALAAGIPIVNVRYWNAVLKAAEENLPLPDFRRFPVEIKEPLISKESEKLHPNENRSKIFFNLLFVHFCKRQYSLFERMIRAAGGKSILYSKKPLTTDKLCFQNVIVLQPSIQFTQSTSAYNSDYDSACAALLERKRRTIPDSEIPLAIFYCSTEKYCNPGFNFGKLLCVEKPADKDVIRSKILVPDTEDITPTSQVLGVVPDSYSSGGLDVREQKAGTSLMKDDHYIDETADSSYASTQTSGKGTTSKGESSVSIQSDASRKRDRVEPVDDLEISEDSSVQVKAKRTCLEDLGTRVMCEMEEPKTEEEEDVFCDRDTSHLDTSNQCVSKEPVPENVKKSGDYVRIANLQKHSTTASSSAKSKDARGGIVTLSDDDSAVPRDGKRYAEGKRKRSNETVSTDPWVIKKPAIDSKKHTNSRIEEPTRLKKKETEKVRLSDRNMWGLIKDDPEETDSDDSEIIPIDRDPVKKESQVKEEPGERKSESSSEDGTLNREWKRHKASVESIESYSEEENMSFGYKTNSENSYNCLSTITPLLRTDIKVESNSVLESARFQKVYDLTPVKRITLSDMYTWNASQLRGTVTVKESSPDSSDNELGEFASFNKRPRKAFRI